MAGSKTTWKKVFGLVLASLLLSFCWQSSASAYEITTLVEPTGRQFNTTEIICTINGQLITAAQDFNCNTQNNRLVLQQVRVGPAINAVEGNYYIGDIFVKSTAEVQDIPILWGNTSTSDWTIINVKTEPQKSKDGNSTYNVRIIVTLMANRTGSMYWQWGDGANWLTYQQNSVSNWQQVGLQNITEAKRSSTNETVHELQLLNQEQENTKNAINSFKDQEQQNREDDRDEMDDNFDGASDDASDQSQALEGATTNVFGAIAQFIGMIPTWLNSRDDCTISLTILGTTGSNDFCNAPAQLTAVTATVSYIAAGFITYKIAKATYNDMIEGAYIT